jgi:sugar/nucleoside kinase (ribokinase family)
MTQTRFDVLTIGNAIVDIIAPVEPGFIESEGMQEGIMHLIDSDRAENLYGKMPLSRQQSSGGSAANTAAGVASLGGRAAFVGKVADDNLGDVFDTDMNNTGVHYTTSRLEDGERTMNTYLGACHELTERDIKPDEIGAAAITYMEGFLWDPVEAKKAFVLAAHYAHKEERAAAFTLSDPFCVDRYRAEFLDLIRSKTIDYVFANVNELKSLYQTEDLGEAVREIAKDAEIAAITMGADGAMAVFNGEVISVPAFPVDKVVDATGAGDLFASGFLLGLARGQNIDSALKTGCLAASEVISHIGARPLVDLGELSRTHGLAG